MKENAAPAELKKCSCGHDRHNPLVIRKNKYSGWGMLGLLTGISVKPVSARYQCTRCGEFFDETTDPVELSKYIM